MKPAVFPQISYAVPVEVRIVRSVETFGERLHRLLEERHYGKPLSKVAKEAGVDFNTLQSALEDKTQPRFQTRLKLADYCQVSVEYLMTGEGEEEPPPVPYEELMERMDRIIEATEQLRADLTRSLERGSR